MSWADTYSHNWHALNQIDVTRFEAVVKGMISDIQVGEMTLAVEALAEQSDAPTSQMIGDNILAIRKVGVKGNRGRYQCQTCYDKGYISFPCWYRVTNLCIYTQKTYMLRVGRECSQFMKDKWPGLVFFEPHHISPCQCQKGLTLMQTWHGARTAPVDVSNLASLAEEACEWITEERLKPVETVKNNLAEILAMRSGVMASQKSEKPPRIVKPKPTSKPKRRKYADMLREEFGVEPPPVYTAPAVQPAPPEPEIPKEKTLEELYNF